MKYQINKGFISQKIGKKLTIFDGEESALYTFNEIGTLIFNQIRKGQDEAKIINFIVKKYKVDQPEAKKDVVELINSLKKSRIIFSVKKKL